MQHDTAAGQVNIDATFFHPSRFLSEKMDEKVEPIQQDLFDSLTFGVCLSANWRRMKILNHLHGKHGLGCDRESALAFSH